MNQADIQAKLDPHENTYQESKRPPLINSAAQSNSQRLFGKRQSSYSKYNTNELGTLSGILKEQMEQGTSEDAKSVLPDKGKKNKVSEVKGKAEKKVKRLLVIQEDMKKKI